MAPSDAAALDAWHAARARVVGASEVAALFGVSPHTSHWSLWQIKAGRVAAPDISGDNRVRWGLRLENVIADAVAEERGWTLLPGGHRTSSRIEGWGCTLDREIGDRGGGVLELKTVDWLVRKRDWGEEPPPHILLQLQAQLGVTGREWGAVAALVGGNELRIWEYQARPRIIAEIAKRVRAFWKSIRENRPPPVDGSPSTADTLAALYPNAARPMLDLRADNLAPEACAGYLRAREAEAAARREKAHYEAILREKAGDAEAVMVNGFTVRLPAVAGTPDRTITPDMVGQTIKGRAGHRRLSVKRFGEGEAA